MKPTAKFVRTFNGITVAAVRFSNAFVNGRDEFRLSGIGVAVGAGVAVGRGVGNTAACGKAIGVAVGAGVAVGNWRREH